MDQLFGSSGPVLGMDKFKQGFGAQLIGCKAEHVFPYRIYLDEIIIETGDGEQVDGKSKETVAAGFGFETVFDVGQFALMFKFLGATQFLGLNFDELGLFVQLDKDG